MQNLNFKNNHINLFTAYNIKWNFCLFILLFFHFSTSLYAETSSSTQPPESTLDINAPLVNKDTDLNSNFDMVQKSITAEQDKLEAKIEEQKKVVLELISAQMFEKASAKIDELKKMTSNLGSSEYVTDKLKSIEKIEKELYTKWGYYLQKKAESSSTNKKWEETLTYAQDSLDKLEKSNTSSPDLIKKDNNLITKAKHGVAKEELNSVTTMQRLIPEYEKENTDIKKYFTLADTYEKDKEYEKARDMLEKILTLNPYNYEAIYKLKQLYLKIGKSGKQRKYMQIKERITQVEWAYIPPVKTEITKKNVIEVSEKHYENNLEDKLEKIIIPIVEFTDAPIEDVLKFLRNESETYDEDDNTSINIEYRTPRVVEEENKNTSETLITMKLANIPLGELIKIICSYANLYYAIEEHAVIISSTPLSNMIVKYIPLKSDIINSIAEVNNIGPEVSEVDDIGTITEETKSDITPISITDDTIKAYFVQRGVPFPGGSAATWDMATGTLIVKNTAENIKILTELLQDIDINLPLVLIEVKFLELTYNKDKGLAFNWQLNLSGGQWKINEFDTEEPGNDKLNNTGDLLNLFQITDNPINIGNLSGLLDFFIYAIEQTTLGETLASPKIITKSGSTALFEMVNNRYLATSWSTVEPEVVYETVQLSSPVPTLEETKLGIILQATPTVSPNNKTIFLDVYPVVKTFAGFDENYTYTIEHIPRDVVAKVEPEFVADITEPMKMPKIMNRDVKSKLMINDGETVVLGGMLYDSTSKELDKYPILGDIPLIGRFFRSEYEVVEQKNLLIFVTTKLINPDGTLLHKPKPRGMFEFKNI